MPRRAGTVARRRPYPARTKRWQRRSIRRGMPYRPIASKIHSFKRTVNLGNIILSSLTETYGALLFKLSDVPSSTDFTNLFDRYRITGVSLKFFPQWTSNDLNPATTLSNINPQVYSVVDYTDSANPLSIAEMMEYGTFKMTRGSALHKRFIRPALLSSSYETVTTSAYTPKWKQWLTTDDPATPHYCLKYAFDRAPSNTACQVKIYATYYIQCKDTK